LHQTVYQAVGTGIRMREHWGCFPGIPFAMVEALKGSGASSALAAEEFGQFD
jgi:hypothetical protein